MDNATTIENTRPTLENAGGFIIRYGLVIILLWIGLLKFTSYEAMGIKPLVANSPIMGWQYSIFSVQGLSIIIGIVEIVVAILIAIGPIAPKISIVGSWGAVIMALITLSFMLSTPGVIQMGKSFPLLSPMPGQFLLKDLLLLGAAVWTAGDSERRTRMAHMARSQ